MLNQLLRQGRIQWHGVRLNQPDWGYDSRSLAATGQVFQEKFLLHLMLNAHWEPLEFELPSPEGPDWRLLVDTYQESPHDIYDVAHAPVVNDSTYQVEPRSVVLLISRIPGKSGSGERQRRRSKRG